MNNNFESTAYDILLNFWDEDKTSKEVYEFYSSLIKYSFFKQEINIEVGVGVETDKEEFEISKKQLTLNNHLYYNYRWSSIVLELTIEKSLINKLLDFEISFYFTNSDDFNFALESLINLFIQKGGFLTKRNDYGVQINNSNTESMINCISLKLFIEKDSEQKIVFSLLSLD